MHSLFIKLKNNIKYRKFYVTSRFKTEVMKYLNVAEKNDAAKNIARYLSNSNSTRHEGYPKIYEFDAEVNGEKSKMVMTSVAGHLLNLEFVNKDKCKSWKSFDPKLLFDEPVKKSCLENCQNIKRTLRKEIVGCKGLIIWTDCDREGENIGFEIIEVCKEVNRHIVVYRAKFSEITAQSVKRALRNLEAPKENISRAVDIRQELDLRTGAVFTRFQTIKLQSQFPDNLGRNIVSYGSCQFPTLGFVVERWRAIKNFISEDFWKLQVNHSYNNISTDFSWDRVRIFDKDVCNILYSVCLENKTAEVVDVKTKPKSKWRPLPLDTVEFEKLASRLLKINAKTAMKLAEKLYIAGIISYPRTETNQFSKDINLAKLVELQKDDPIWGQYAQNVLADGPNPRNGNKSDQAHPPIHPTKYVNNLVGDERRVYEFVVRSFLACCGRDAQGVETAVSLRVAGEAFRAAGLVVTQRNYLDVYPYDKWNSKEINNYRIGETFIPTKIEMLEGQTSPPECLTESDLISLMDKHGIGTDATHADHIETIKSRNYVKLRDNRFEPTKLGMGLVEGYDALSLPISKPNLRAQFEADLKLICEGRKLPEVVLREQIASYKEVYDKIRADENKLIGEVSKHLNDPSAELERPPQSTGSRHNPVGRNEASNSSNTSSVMCRCNRPATLLTSRRQNQNFGRKFYKCADCDFFEWAENNSNVRNPNETPPSSEGSSNGTNAAGGARSRAPRCCSLCRRPGHNILNCPARGM